MGINWSMVGINKNFHFFFCVCVAGFEVQVEHPHQHVVKCTRLVRGMCSVRVMESA